MDAATWIGLCGVAVAGVGLAFTAYAVHRSNQNSSAATLLSLIEAARQGWERFLSADEEGARNHQFADLANLFEIGCAFQVKGIFVGVSRELLADYLDDNLKLLSGSSDARTRIESLIHSETTFCYLRRYLRSRPLIDDPDRASEEAAIEVQRDAAVS